MAAPGAVPAAVPSLLQPKLRVHALPERLGGGGTEKGGSIVFYTHQDARAAGARAAGGLTASARLRVETKAAADATFDVFLSHCLTDAQEVLGVKALLEAAHLSVYVDWVEDPQLDRSRVTPATAARLRQRMNTCRSLVFATSHASASSKWMPWELGYFDGKGGKVSILPLVDSPQDTFAGQEYLGLYPLIENRTGVLSGRREPHAVRSGAQGKEAVPWRDLIHGRPYRRAQ